MRQPRSLINTRTSDRTRKPSKFFKRNIIQLKTVKGSLHLYRDANASCLAWCLLAIAVVTGDALAREFAPLEDGFHSTLAYALQRLRSTPNANAAIFYLSNVKGLCISNIDVSPLVSTSCTTSDNNPRSFM